MKGDFKKRAQFLISKSYASQPLSGEMYRDLKKHYLVCVLNFTLFPEEEVFFDEYMYRNSRGKVLTDDQNITFVELSKIDEILEKPVDELNDIEMWSVFLRFASDKDKRDVINKILSRKDGINMGAQILETISKDERERIYYEEQLLYEADRLADKRHAMRTAEENKALQIARSLKMSKFPLDAISNSTGISLEVLQSL